MPLNQGWRKNENCLLLMLREGEDLNASNPVNQSKVIHWLHKYNNALIHWLIIFSFSFFLFLFLFPFPFFTFNDLLVQLFPQALKRIDPPHSSLSPLNCCLHLNLHFSSHCFLHHYHHFLQNQIRMLHSFHLHHVSVILIICRLHPKPSSLRRARTFWNLFWWFLGT